MASTEAQAVVDMPAASDAVNPSRKCKQHFQTLTIKELTDKSTQVNQIQSPLLKLPAEIRGIIYEYVFCDLVVRVNTDKPRLKRYRTYLQPFAIRQLCRQIRHEARSAYFKYTKFYFRRYHFEYEPVALLLGEDTCNSIRLIKVEPEPSYHRFLHSSDLPEDPSWPFGGAKAHERIKRRWKSIEQIHIMVAPLIQCLSPDQVYEIQFREHMRVMFGNQGIQFYINDD